MIDYNKAETVTQRVLLLNSALIKFGHGMQWYFWLPTFILITPLIDIHKARP